MSNQGWSPVNSSFDARLIKTQGERVFPAKKKKRKSVKCAPALNFKASAQRLPIRLESSVSLQVGGSSWWFRLTARFSGSSW